MATRRRTEPAPRKALGQHFLRDTGVLADIAAAVQAPGGVVLEVGPGTGELTAALLERGFAVRAVELDDRLVGHLRKRFAGADFRVVQADARDVDIDLLLPEGEYAVAANLPYFAANPIIRRFLEAERPPTTLVVMVQREVASELTAPEGKVSLLTVATRIYATAEHLFDVPPEAFDPPPKVHSSVVRLTLRPEPLVPRERLDDFFTLVSRTFRNPRKQLHNAVAGASALDIDAAREVIASARIDSARRPETLTIAEWLELLDAVRARERDA